MADITEKNKQILSVRDLYVDYVTKDETVNAVNGVSFDLNYGETLGLVGETGAGKTTIVKSILRILPVPPAVLQGGEIYVDGENILEYPEEDMRKIRGSKISMVFQDPMTALNPIKRIGDQVAEGILIHQKCSKAEAEAQAKEILRLVGIQEDRYREYPHQFSGGMKQRVVIAIALACNPDLLIADEPTTALDVTIQAQVLELIKELQEKSNSAMILITHDFGIVAQTCDNVGVVYAGRIIEYGSKQQVFKHPTHPYTKGLFGAIPSLEKEVERLTPIEGAPPNPTNLPTGCHFRPRCKYAMPECSEHVETYTTPDGHKCMCNLCKGCAPEDHEAGGAV